MKQKFAVAIIALITISCQKQMGRTEKNPILADKQKIAGGTKQEQPGNPNVSDLQLLIQKWTLWAYAKPFEQWPNFDQDGHLQYLQQCNDCGVYMLTGGNIPNPYYTRSVTIDIAQYQYVFTPLIEISAWYDACHPDAAPKNEQSPEGGFKSTITGALNGQRDLSLTWDGRSILSNNRNDYRANSGVFQAPQIPEFYTGCSVNVSTWYSDGYWAKIPLTVGTHTLVFGGSINWKKMEVAGFNLVTYNITVIDSRNP